MGSEDSNDDNDDECVTIMVLWEGWASVLLCYIGSDLYDGIEAE
jgi:hypothetical protein